MKLAILALVLSACAHAPHNYAEAFVAAANPEADRAPLGAQGVLLHQETQVFACFADNPKHITTCHLIADWTPPPAATSPASSPAPKLAPTAETKVPDATPPKPDATPPKPDATPPKPAETKPEAKPDAKAEPPKKK